MNKWEEIINISHVWKNENLTFEEQRDAIVRIFKKSNWYKNADQDELSNIIDIVDELAHADDVEEFDGWWNDMYDLADYERVWIRTI